MATAPARGQNPSGNRPRNEIGNRTGNRNRNRNGDRNRQPSAQARPAQTTSSRSRTANNPPQYRPVARTAPREQGLFMRGFTRLYRHCRKKMSALQTILLMAGVLYLLFAVLYFGGKIHAFYANTVRPDDVTYITVDPKKTTETVSTVIPAQIAYRGQSLPYINLSEIAKEAGLMTIGNSKQIRLISAEDAGASALFRNGDIHVSIGDATITLPVPVQIVDQTVYVPYSFFAEYISGYETSFDKATGELRLLRQIDQTLSTEENAVFLPLQYRLQSIQTTEPIKEEFPDELWTSEIAQ